MNKVIDAEKLWNRLISVSENDWVGFDTIDEVLSEMPAEPRWIPVTERLPEEHEEVLTSDSVFGITFDSLHNGKWRKHPVAWMPLPEPYKGGEKE